VWALDLKAAGRQTPPRPFFCLRIDAGRWTSVARANPQERAVMIRTAGFAEMGRPAPPCARASSRHVSERIRPRTDTTSNKTRTLASHLVIVSAGLILD
jgi:hypothetical protein